MTDENKALQNWSNDIAAIIADAMLDAKLINEEQFEEWVDVIGLELFVRCICGDYPPSLAPKLLSNNSQ